MHACSSARWAAHPIYRINSGFSVPSQHTVFINYLTWNETKDTMFMLNVISSACYYYILSNATLGPDGDEFHFTILIAQGNTF